MLTPHDGGGELPQIMHIVFEVAMHNVLKTAFPEATIKCCRFHLGQAWEENTDFGLKSRLQGQQ